MRQPRCVPSALLGLGVFLSLAGAAMAQPAMQVVSAEFRGTMGVMASTPGGIDTPTDVTLQQTGVTPVSISTRADSTDGNCAATSTGSMTLVFYDLSNGAVQVNGSNSTVTGGQVVSTDAPLEPPFFSTGTTTTSSTLTLRLHVNRWSYLSFAANMYVGRVTAVGITQASSGELTESWQITDGAGNVIAARDLTINSADPARYHRDLVYNTVLAPPGDYVLTVTHSGLASGDLAVQGATGWTGYGSYGVSLSAASITCIADYDENGVLDSRDLFEFLSGFFQEATDFNQDGVVDSRDLFDFLNAFLLGCG